MKLDKKCSLHDVKYIHSGRKNFFEVQSGLSNKKYSVMLDFSCDCKTAVYNNKPKLCSHVLAVLEEIVLEAKITEPKCVMQKYDLTIARRNACLNLVRESNRVLDQIRKSGNESDLHYNTKNKIVELLRKQGKRFICEPRFKEDIGFIPDILVLDDFEVIEIAVSEKKESLERKFEQCKQLGLKFSYIEVKG